MYSFPSRAQRRHPFARFIAIGYGSKYFTFAVTPPGKERRARSEYARDAFVGGNATDFEVAFPISTNHRGSAEIVFVDRGGRTTRSRPERGFRCRAAPHPTGSTEAFLRP